MAPHHTIFILFLLLHSRHSTAWEPDVPSTPHTLVNTYAQRVKPLAQVAGTTSSPTATTTLYPGQVPCAPSQFQCANGQCVVQSAGAVVCDGFPDCIDASDERSCDVTHCGEGNISCDDSSRCVDRAHVCDTYFDCKDGTDEMNCGNTTCRTDEFRCNSGNCIPKNKTCNGLLDCKDASDELYNCSTVVNVSICNSSELGCVVGGCVGLERACDGVADCPDASDERDQICLTCASGLQKYSKALRCDGVADCADGSDERSCASCSLTSRLCQPTQQCIRSSLWCDRVYDCLDGSDERSCDCPQDMHKCTGYHCIPSSLVCDGYVDCPLADDEDAGVCQAKCGKGMYQCIGGSCISNTSICDGVVQCPRGEDESGDFCRQVGKCIDRVHWRCGVGGKECIYKEWVCDGVEDCVGGEDELNTTCAEVLCKDTQFRCPSEMKCVEKGKRCDGEVDCEDSSDELGCVFTQQLIGSDTKIVYVQRQNHLYPLCKDNSTDRQTLICNYISISSRSDFKDLSNLNESTYVHFRHSHNYYGLKNINRDLAQTQSCPAGLLNANCIPPRQNCGRRLRPYSPLPLIDRGVPQYYSESYNWPWVVLIKTGDGSVCLGSLVSQLKIMTSADCVSDMGVAKSTNNMTAYLGTTNYFGVGGVRTSIIKISLHPQYDWLTGQNNVAMVHMYYPIAFSASVQPICRPDALQQTPYTACYMVGFGEAVVKQVQPPYLTDLRLKLTSHKDCILALNRTKPPSSFPVLQYVDYQHHLCAHFYGATLGSNICMGAFSGAPLVCERLDGIWEQVGVGESFRGNEACKVAIFTNVKPNLDFVYQEIN